MSVFVASCRHEAELAQAANQPLPDDDDDAFEQRALNTLLGWFSFNLYFYLGVVIGSCPGNVDNIMEDLIFGNVI